MRQYSLFDTGSTEMSTSLDGSMQSWNEDRDGVVFEFQASNQVALMPAHTLIASTIFRRITNIPAYLAKNYNLGNSPLVWHAFRVSVIGNENKQAYALCEFVESSHKIVLGKVAVQFKEIPQELLENRVLEAVNNFAADFWHRYKPAQVVTSNNQKEVLPGLRYSSLVEHAMLERLSEVKDLRGNNTGWKEMEYRNGGNQLQAIALISSDGRYAVSIHSRDPASGTEQYITRAAAQSYAIDHSYIPVTPEHQHVGFNIYPLLVKDSGLMYGVQSIENLKMRKERGFGDDLHKTVEAAHQAADRQVVRMEEIRAYDEARLAAQMEAEAKKIANSLLSLSERRANSVLEKMVNYASIGLAHGTRRECMDMAINKGFEFVEKMVMDDAAKARDEKTLQQVSERGYILGLSNENLPLVKSGLETRERLRANDYLKPGYRLFVPGGEGVFINITKTEFDYAQSRIENIRFPEAEKSMKSGKPAVER